MRCYNLVMWSVYATLRSWIFIYLLLRRQLKNFQEKKFYTALKGIYTCFTQCLASFYPLRVFKYTHSHQEVQPVCCKSLLLSYFFFEYVTIAMFVRQMNYDNRQTKRRPNRASSPARASNSASELKNVTHDLENYFSASKSHSYNKHQCFAPDLVRLVTACFNSTGTVMNTTQTNFTISDFYVLNKSPTLRKLCSLIYFTAKSLYMFRVAQHPSSGVMFQLDWNNHEYNTDKLHKFRFLYIK